MPQSGLRRTMATERHNEYRVIVQDRHFAIGRVCFEQNGSIRPEQCSPSGFNREAFLTDLKRYRGALKKPWVRLQLDPRDWHEIRHMRTPRMPARAPTLDDGMPYIYEYRAGCDAQGNISVYQCFYRNEFNPVSDYYSEIHDVCSCGRTEEALLVDLRRYIDSVKKPVIDVAGLVT